MTPHGQLTGLAELGARSPCPSKPLNNPTRKLPTPLNHKSLTCTALRDKLLAGQAFPYLAHERAFVAAPPRALSLYYPVTLVRISWGTNG